MAEKNLDLIIIGKISSPYGIKGWVKIYSHTDPIDNILSYNPWWIHNKGEWLSMDVVEGRIHGKNIVAHIESIDDRDSAEAIKACDIAIERKQMAQPEPGEFYWIDLIGLKVINEQGQQLGVVDHLFETGANDVLVVTGDKERLIPYVMDEVVKEVNLSAGTILVDWDADF